MLATLFSSNAQLRSMSIVHVTCRHSHFHYYLCVGPIAQLRSACISYITLQSICIGPNAQLCSISIVHVTYYVTTMCWPKCVIAQYVHPVVNFITLVHVTCWHSQFHYLLSLMCQTNCAVTQWYLLVTLLCNRSMSIVHVTRWTKCAITQYIHSAVNFITYHGACYMCIVFLLVALLCSQYAFDQTRNCAEC